MAKAPKTTPAPEPSPDTGVTPLPESAPMPGHQDGLYNIPPDTPPQPAPPAPPPAEPQE